MSDTVYNSNLVSLQWRVANLRLTAFASQIPFPADGAELFQDFFTFTPDEETRRKGEFMSEFSSGKAGVLYQTVIAGSKIDFIATAGFSTTEVPNEMPTLPVEGNFETMFCEAAERLVSKIPGFARLAVGAHFLLPVESKVAGYTKMAELLPTIKIDPKGSSDFQYRINRRLAMELDGKQVWINRLVTWGCLGFQLQIVGSSAGASRVGDAVSAITDVNTEPNADFSTLAPAHQQTIIKGLFSNSRDLVEKGDVV